MNPVAVDTPSPILNPDSIANNIEIEFTDKNLIEKNEIVDINQIFSANTSPEKKGKDRLSMPGTGRNSSRKMKSYVQVGSPSRSSIQKQEIDCFSSDVEGVLPEADGTVIVNELDISAIVDPNKLVVIGYENGKDSILVPENEI